MQVKHCVLPALQAGAAQVAMDEKKLYYSICVAEGAV
jgi:hypothetical protein